MGYSNDMSFFLYRVIHEKIEKLSGHFILVKIKKKYKHKSENAYFFLYIYKSTLTLEI